MPNVYFETGFQKLELVSRSVFVLACVRWSQPDNDFVHEDLYSVCHVLSVRALQAASWGSEWNAGDILVV